MRKKRKNGGGRGHGDQQQEKGGEEKEEEVFRVAVKDKEAVTPVQSRPLPSKKRPATDSKCYSRRRRKLEAAGATDEEENSEDEDAPSTCPLPLRPKSVEAGEKPRRASSVKKAPPTAKIPREFVEEQKKYFAEVDAFELPTEESSSESD